MKIIEGATYCESVEELIGERMRLIKLKIKDREDGVYGGPNGAYSSVDFYKGALSALETLNMIFETDSKIPLRKD